MKQNHFVIVAAIALVALLTAGLALAGPPLQGPDGQGNTPVDAPPAGRYNQHVGTDDTTTYNLAPGHETDGGGGVEPAGLMNYQGRLMLNGDPFSGTIPMTFTLYTDPVTGTTAWQEQQPVQVDNGLFNVLLGSVEPLDDRAGAFISQLWLGVQPEGAAELTPRQPLATAGYAMNVMPGAYMLDLNEGGPYGYSFNVRSVNHPAIYGATHYTDSIGMHGRAYHPGGVGVYGQHISSEGTEPGVKGESDSTSSFAAAVVGRITPESPGGYSAGVRGISEGTGGNGIGVWGSHPALGWGVYGTAAGGLGVYGRDSGGGAGVFGRSSEGNGVYGETSSSDLNAAAGVQGYNNSDGGAAIRGDKQGGGGLAVYGRNQGTTGSAVSGQCDEYYAIFGHSNYRGVYGQTSRGDNNYGLYTPDNLYSLNYHLAGATMQLAQNGGSEPLEPGDVVVFIGMAAPLEEGGPPVVQVAKATSANSTAVAGVVHGRFDIAAVSGPEEQDDGTNSKQYIEVTPEGPVPAGEHLLLVVQGPVQVKTSALSGAIQPGDLLSSADAAGYAGRAGEITVDGATIAMPGSVFGKALEPLDAGEGQIYVYVTLK